MRASNDNTLPPVYKVGAVIIRFAADGEPEFLITRPIAKRDVAPLVLPRGSHKGLDPDTGKWIDLYEEADAIRCQDNIEPMESALKREMFEEAGITPELLQGDGMKISDLGVRIFPSKKGPTQVRWLVLEPDEATQKAMIAKPEDASEPTRWMRLGEIEQKIEEGDFSKGYLPIIEEAKRKIEYEHRDLKPLHWESESLVAGAVRTR